MIRRNWVRDHVGSLPADARALVDDTTGREWTFGELLAASGAVAGLLAERGVRRGDVVLALLGNTIENVLLTLACLHLGAPLLPCSEQLRAKDVALRVRRATPVLIVADRRNAAALDALDVPVLLVPDSSFTAPRPAPPYESLAEDDPAFVLFTSGTTGEPKLVRHGQRFVWGQQLQATGWLAAEAGELVWSTAAPGWSKSARNCFIAPWWCGAAAVIQDARFSADGRLDTIERLAVNVLCMAPTEYRLIASSGLLRALPSLRRLVTAGEALGVPAAVTWRSATGLAISDGYGQTETGQVTGTPPGMSSPPGSMGRALPGVSVSVVDGELCVDPATMPAFFLGYDGEPAPDGVWHTGDTVRMDDDGWLYFVSRADDVIISAGYRIGPAEVESTLAGHPAVAECAVLGVPDVARGAVVGAAVVLRSGYVGSEDLVLSIQEFVKAETAPYKYPRQVWFVDNLPKTTSGKLLRSAITLPDIG